MADGDILVDAILRRHPDPLLRTDLPTLRAHAAAARTPVELMRLAALLGERNGHTGIFADDAHPTPLHAYPLGLYELTDGVFVVESEAEELVGRELTQIAGVGVGELLAALEPLVPRDNEWTVRERRPRYLVTAEVLRGLDVVDRVGPLELTGRTFEPRPWPERAARPQPPWTTAALDGGRALHVAYNVTRGDPSELAAEIGASNSELIVLDLRRNGGGDNRTYGPLLAALEQAAERGARLAVLIGRATFSAAMQLVVDLERRTPAVFVGEPTGGSPNHYGDAEPVDLPESGLRAHAATRAWLTAGADDERLTREPDVHVPLDSRAYFARRDPVLEAALSAT